VVLDKALGDWDQVAVEQDQYQEVEVETLVPYQVVLSSTAPVKNTTQA